MEVFAFFHVQPSSWGEGWAKGINWQQEIGEYLCDLLKMGQRGRGLQSRWLAKEFRVKHYVYIQRRGRRHEDLEISYLLLCPPVWLAVSLGVPVRIGAERKR